MKIKFDDYFMRSWNAGDSQSLQKYADNRKVWLNLRDVFPHPYSDEDARFWIELALSQEPQRSFAIASREEAIGGIGLVFGEDVHSRAAELGYWLGEPFWGKGIMSSAVSCFTEYDFQHFQVLRIFAEPFASNLASRHVLEKAGFSLEGVLKKSVIKDGLVQDQALYALIRN